MNNNERIMVSIVDSYNDEVYNVILNEKEVKFLRWLSTNSLFHDEVTYNIIEGCSEDFS